MLAVRFKLEAAEAKVLSTQEAITRRSMVPAHKCKYYASCTVVRNAEVQSCERTNTCVTLCHLGAQESKVK